MKKIGVIISVIFLCQVSKGQEMPKRFEFGSTLLTINSLTISGYLQQDKRPIELINGLFFRYTSNRLAVRVFTSYSESYSSYTAPKLCADCESGEINSKDFRIGMGGQLNLLKNKEWLYTFIDLSYRNLFSAGNLSGGLANLNEDFSKTTNGADSFFGIGFKVKTFKSICISPELGYNVFNGYANYSTTSLISGISTRANSINMYANPVAKLHLTVQF